MHCMHHPITSYLINGQEYLVSCNDKHCYIFKKLQRYPDLQGDSKGVEMGTVNTFLLSFSVIISFFLQGTEAASCPKDWKIYQDVCYGVIQTYETWSEAEVDCQSRGLGGHLASILRESEAAMISGMLRHSYPNVKELWVGLQDPRQTGRWQWSDSNPFNFKAWSQCSVGIKGHCAYISRRTGFKEFEKSSCHMSRAYLCKSTM
ncbi:regenerating islet-derived protein 4-like [Anolis carolinensis]|uniref:regenerating islet-derived protein 4-like n=1 Tax=Anolis carolinensis TaxID=28377 RepID=UPI002F2B6FFB